MSDIHEISRGRWPGILLSLDVIDQCHLPRKTIKHETCPICSGKDKFRFDDKDGRGTWICTCGSGNGVDLVMQVKGLAFRDAAKLIEQAAGNLSAVPVSVSEEIDFDKRIKTLRRVWCEASPLTIGDEIHRYLSGRGLSLEVLPENIRLHHSMSSYEDGKLEGHFPTMLAKALGPEGDGRTLHRTFLKDGKKAAISQPKKLMSGKPLSGGAIRLFPVARCIGIAEGIETALAAGQLFGIPVWSCISANGISSFVPPAGVEHVVIFADNDESFTGQDVAFSAARRLKRIGVDVEVKIPPVVGDWLDVLIKERVSKA